MSSAGPTGSSLRVRPLSLGEILDEVFRVCRRHFWVLVAIALPVSLPSLVVQFAGGSASQARRRGVGGPLAARELA